jgi:hypothetical protein
MTTIGCIMAEVVATDFGEIINASLEGHVRLIFCQTTESESNNLFVTPRMRQLGEAGYLPIAIARIDSSDPSKFFLCAASGLSEDLRFALEHQGCDQIQDALRGSADGRNVPSVSN